MAFLRKLENAMQLEEEKTRGIGTSVDSEEEQMCADIKAMREEMKVRIAQTVSSPSKNQNPYNISDRGTLIFDILQFQRIHEAVDAAGALVVLYGTWKVLKWMFC